MGLRRNDEKPAIVLWFVFAVGWLPALVCAYALHPTVGPPLVLSGAGSTGARAADGLVVTLGVLTFAYARALRRPPGQRELVVAALGSLCVALAMPVLFSADVYAYAYYGDVATHGQNPYGHAPRPPVADPLEAAAVLAWDGRVPPRCVYGPLAVALAAFADLAGHLGGLAGAIGAQRLTAALAYVACCVLSLRLLTDPRARAALLLNPVVIWSVAEGHNDAAMLALVLAGLRWPARGAIFLALGALVKAPALVMWGRLERWPTRIAATGLVVLGYAPLAFAVAHATGEAATMAVAASGAMTARVGAGEAVRAAVVVNGGALTVSGGARNMAVSIGWESPLGLLASQIGAIPAAAIDAFLLAVCAFVAARFAKADRVPAFALAAWFGLPNAYPWYALWIVPLAARNLSSPWARALLVAALIAPIRAITDAIFSAPDLTHSPPPLALAMIALQYLVPLAALASGLVEARTRARVVITAIVIAMSFGAPVCAQTLAPTPLPSAPAPVVAPPAGPPSPSPVATAAAAPAATSPAPNPSAAPAPIGTSGPATPIPATPAPVPSATPAPTAMPTVAPSPTPAPTEAPTPTPTPTPNPFSYIINPAPVPVTTPDGPHILQVAVNDRHIRLGGPLIVRVVTSANVVGVEARALGRFIAIPQSAPGLFGLIYTLPDGIPFWLLNRNYTVVIAAATADGRQTTVAVPMLLTR